MKAIIVQLLTATLLADTAHGQALEPFKYESPGKLVPPTSGTGDLANRRIYASQMGLPIKLTNQQHMYPNSQVHRKGGSIAGDQCDRSNYSMPWTDDFCEIRDRPTPLCPSGKGHQGVDVRPPLCRPKAQVSAIAVEDGTIASVNNHTSSVILKGNRDGTSYIYLHLEPSTIRVRPSQAVTAGQELGKISNFMNGSPQTTIHLHFEIKQNVAFRGRTMFVNVPPYPSLVHAYRKRL